MFIVSRHSIGGCVHLSVVWIFLTATAHIGLCQAETSQEQSATIPPAVFKAWRDAGFRASSGYKQLLGSDPQLVKLPIFRLEIRSRPVRTAGFISKLPAPEVPFGIGINFSEETSAEAILAEVGALRHLQYLGLGGKPVTDAAFKVIGRLTELRSLRLSYTQVSDHGFRELSTLTKLRELDLGQSRLSDEGIAAMAPLKSLEALDAADTKITGRGFRELSALRILNVNGAYIDDDGLFELGELPQLREVDLNGTNITGVEFGRLKSLEVLSVCALRTKLSETGIREIGTLENLRSLLIDNLDDEQVKLIARLPNLEMLYLADSSVTDEGLRSLSKSKSLRKLNLVRCPNLSAIGLRNLAPAPKLEELFLSLVPVKDAALKELSAFGQLKKLTLNDNLGITHAGLCQHIREARTLETLSVGALRLAEDGKFVTDLQKAELRQALPPGCTLR